MLGKLTVITGKDNDGDQGNSFRLPPPPPKL